jgi:hypothetical protein
LRIAGGASLFAAMALSPSAFALDVPSDTEIQIRLKTKVSTQTSKPHDRVEAVIKVPVMAGDQFAIPAGAFLRGEIDQATQSTKGDERSVLALRFAELEINSSKIPVSTQLTSVDNARENVDQQGQISGILASETITGRLDDGLNRLAQRYAGFADVLRQARNAVLKPPESDITYDAGVEMSVRTTAAIHLPGPSGPGLAGQAGPIPSIDRLAALIAREPFQTVAQSPPKPSDITNILLIGSEDQVQKAFADAGWSAAAGLTGRAKFETFRALAEDRGYNEAPVSVLLLDGMKPDLVFEKLNNTFARRHHLRIWHRPGTFMGQPVWAFAATHDIGINFSEVDRTFIHKIDSNIDNERAKVVTDLVFAGHVQGIALLPRPQVPGEGQNATGDKLETDGSLAVLQLK